MANIIHGNSAQSQGEFFRQEADKAVRSNNRAVCGKGCAWRTLPSTTYKDNYDTIFRKKEPKCKTTT